MYLTGAFEILNRGKKIVFKLYGPKGNFTQKIDWFSQIFDQIFELF